MKKLVHSISAIALAMFWLASASMAGAVSAHAQELDPALIDGLTEAINNRNPESVLAHFVAGATVTFDNSAFKVPNDTISAAEYAARFRANNPDVPADVRMEVAPGSVQISTTGAKWTWRQTAGFLRDMGIDFIEFTVTATTEARKFKSLTIAPTQETIARIPYSPPSGGAGPNPGPGMPSTGVGSSPGSALVVISLALTAVGLVLTGARPRRRRSES
jgi:hypothetical protein